ncbi:MAG: HPP family protein [Sulfurimonas sp.]|uniref:HPP family protein n=1 Tax=Sulfurimonas sp. TaxID=2022749 RepID=UPI00261A5EFE|nr:HPP family protein [Sulfurimonas sp.]MDD5400105.1 HPP family protein [Sulfurimonas sp.]
MPKKYLQRMMSKGARPARKPASKILWSVVGSFVGIYVMSIFSNSFSTQDSFFLLGSFGASAVLIYGAPEVPFSQPRNLIGGHVLSAIVSVFLVKSFGNLLSLELLCALSVALSVLVMHLTITMHPPGGATALIYVIGSEKIQSLGWIYPLSPIALGVTMMLIIALIVNNISNNTKRHYPTYWY